MTASQIARRFCVPVEGSVAAYHLGLLQNAEAAVLPLIDDGGLLMEPHSTIALYKIAGQVAGIEAKEASGETIDLVTAAYFLGVAAAWSLGSAME